MDTEIQTLIARSSRPEYVHSIEVKHFHEGGAGSKFTGVRTVEELLTLALRQRKSLNGDDRNALMLSGAPESSFLPLNSGVRYLKVNTPGEEALADTATLPEDAVLTVQAKGKSDGRLPSLSFVYATFKLRRSVNYGTVIIGPETGADNQLIVGTEVLWTAHPGVATLGVPSETVRDAGLDDGSTLTVAEFRQLFSRDIQVNTKRV